MFGHTFENDHDNINAIKLQFVGDRGISHLINIKSGKYPQKQEKRCEKWMIVF